MPDGPWKIQPWCNRPDARALRKRGWEVAPANVTRTAAAGTARAAPPPAVAAWTEWAEAALFVFLLQGWLRSWFRSAALH